MPSVLSTLLRIHECTCADVGHTWHPSCFAASAEIFLDVMRVCPGIYPPLYLIAMILRGKGIEHLPRTLVDSFRSSIFLALNGFGFVTSYCALTKLQGGQNYFSSFIPGFCGGMMAILAERKSRRSVLGLYTSQMAVDFIFHQLKFRGFTNGIASGEVYLFSVMAALMMCMYRHGAVSRSGFMGSITRFLMWENQSGNGESRSEAPAGRSLNESMYRQSVETLRQFYQKWSRVVCARLPRHPLTKPLFNSVEVGMRGFLLGYGLQTALALLGNLRSVLKTPGTTLSRVFANKNSAMFGCFLGGFVGVYKALLVLLHGLRGKDDPINTAIAGAIGGLAMFFFPSPSIATNLGSKVVEMMYLELNHAGKLPSYYYFDCLMYAFTFGILTHGANMEPHNMRQSYYKFLVYITGGKWGEVDHYFYDRFGTQASYLKRHNSMPRIR
eukprot:scpid56545/ scgid23552/ Transmembrane protein 135; Peroxisomal membrane protein 52